MLTSLLVALTLGLVTLAFVAVRRMLGAWRIDGLSRRAVLITGCDSGFGQALALRCAAAGMPVFAACLTKQGTEQLKAEYHETAVSSDEKPTLITFIMDVADEASVRQARAFVDAQLADRCLNGLHGLVNNAGIVGNVSLDDWLTVEDYESIWRVNLLGLIRVTHAFKQLVKRTRSFKPLFRGIWILGRIVNTASICGRVALPGFGPYTVSKYGVEAYNDTLRLEMIQFGVSVCLLEPGFFRTPLTDAKRQCIMLERLWERLDDNTREEYGQPYFEFTRQQVIGHLNRCSDRLELVVDAYFHALTAALPHSRYAVGFDSAAGFVPFSMLPTSIQDWIFWVLSKLIGAPLPCAILRRKNKNCK